jgi:peptidoglycan hydrolase-like protein with peptidoglycan-binding domain
MLTLTTSILSMALALSLVTSATAADGDRDGKRDGTVSETVDRVKKKVTGDQPDREQDPVKAAQKSLAAKGYDVGDADGRLGPKTRAAVQAFQKDEGLRVTGRLDRETMARLRDGKAGDRPSAATSTEEKDRSASASPATDREPKTGPGATSKAPTGEMAKDVQVEKEQDKRK